MLRITWLGSHTYYFHEVQIMYIIMLAIRSCGSWLPGFYSWILWILDLEPLFCCEILDLQCLLCCGIFKMFGSFYCRIVGCLNSWFFNFCSALGCWDPGSWLSDFPTRYSGSWTLELYFIIRSYGSWIWFFAVAHVWLQLFTNATYFL